MLSLFPVDGPQSPPRPWSRRCRLLARLNLSTLQELGLGAPPPCLRFVVDPLVMRGGAFETTAYPLTSLWPAWQGCEQVA